MLAEVHFFQACIWQKPFLSLLWCCQYFVSDRVVNWTLWFLTWISTVLSTWASQRQRRGVDCQEKKTCKRKIIVLHNLIMEAVFHCFHYHLFLKYNTLSSVHTLWKGITEVHVQGRLGITVSSIRSVLPLNGKSICFIFKFFQCHSSIIIYYNVHKFLGK